jgi:prephenate dehydrogenase
MEDHFSRAHVCIIGLGLMGGSLGMALRASRACRRVTGVARQSSTCDLALAMGAVDEATMDALPAVRQADIVVLATPVRTIARQVATIGQHMAPGALLMDMGSTKSEIVREMEKLPAHVQVIGGHPMCGKERAGIAVAEATLYQGKVFCLAPLERTSPEALALAHELVRAVGARPLVIDSKRHDALVAVTSHLPYLMAAALTATASQSAAIDPLTWQLAASGFRDTSRLAGSDVEMMLDILLTNRGNVAAGARQAAGRLLDMAAAIDSGDEAALCSALTETQRVWREVYR